MTHFRSHLLAAFAVAGLIVSADAIGSSAQAQASGCEQGQKIIAERRSLGEQFQKLSNGGKNKQLDPRAACSLFTKLSANGENGLKWMTENKDWCQVPDKIVDDFSTEHKRIQTIKGQACGAAAKMAEMEKRAKEQAQQRQQGGLAGKMGGGLTGTLSVPKGAL